MGEGGHWATSGGFLGVSEGPRRNCAGKGSADLGPKTPTSGQISEFSPGIH